MLLLLIIRAVSLVFEFHWANLRSALLLLPIYYCRLVSVVMMLLLKC